jgi:hypothetical protein
MEDCATPGDAISDRSVICPFKPEECNSLFERCADTKQKGLSVVCCEFVEFTLLQLHLRFQGGFRRHPSLQAGGKQPRGNQETRTDR